MPQTHTKRALLGGLSKRNLLTWLCGVGYAGVCLPSNWRVETKTRSDGATDKVPSVLIMLLPQLPLS